MIQRYPILLGLSFFVFFPFETFANVPVANRAQLIRFEQREAMYTTSLPPVTMNAQPQSFENDEDLAFAQDTKEVSSSEQLMLDKLHGIQQEVNELRAQFEKQVQDLKLLQQQQITFYKDLDSRLQNNSNPVNNVETSVGNLTQEQHASLQHKLSDIKLETAEGRSEKVLDSESQSASQPLAIKNQNHIFSANEQISYLAAYDLLKNKRFDEALSAMQIFTVQYPQGGYTANAQYWLGELYMVKNNYAKAIEHFEMVLKKFPLSSKRAASTLKIGYALAASGKIEEAKSRLEEVLRNYPDTPTAQLAITKLESLGVL